LTGQPEFDLGLRGAISSKAVSNTSRPFLGSNVPKKKM